MFLKKVSLILATALLAFSLTGCGGGDKKEEKKAPAADKPIKIGVTAGPHAEIMDNVKKLAEKQGLKIEVVEFNDFVTPNVALNQGELFANSMQHASPEPGRTVCQQHAACTVSGGDPEKGTQL